MVCYYFIQFWWLSLFTVQRLVKFDLPCLSFRIMSDMLLCVELPEFCQAVQQIVAHEEGHTEWLTWMPEVQSGGGDSEVV